jgi:hypothetical protein
VYESASYSGMLSSVKDLLLDQDSYGIFAFAGQKME